MFRLELAHCTGSQQGRVQVVLARAYIPGYMRF